MRNFFQLITVLALSFSLQACQSTKDGASLSNEGPSDEFTYNADGNIIGDEGAEIGDGSGRSNRSSYDIDGTDLGVFSKMPGTSDDARAYDRVFFSYDSSALGRDSQDVLDMQASWLKKNETVRISIEGHADERGTREYNLALGEKRANAVRNYLVATGVGSNRISLISFGKERPISFDNSESSHYKNRRAVTVLNNVD